MEKQISNHAAAAKEIRQYLKAKGIKGRVRAKTYSMGSSVDVWVQEDINPALAEEIRLHCGQYQYGHFDGMIDLYEMSNCRDDIPQVKHVFVHVDYSNDLKQRVWDYIRKVYAEMDEAPADYHECGEFYSNHWHAWGSTLVHRLLEDRNDVVWNGGLNV
jgi:hypothetical protein